MTTLNPSPFSLEALLKRLFSELERPGAPTKIMEDWQALGVLLQLYQMLQQVAVEGEKRGLPPVAFLVTMTQSQSNIAYNEAIRVRATLASGISEEMGLEALWTRSQEIHDVTPITPYVAYILYVHRRLFAWDVRSALPALAHLPEIHRQLGLLSRGPQEARAHRRAAFRKLSLQDRAEVVHDALTSDIFEPGRKRVPLKGLLVKGGINVLDTGGMVDPFRVFRSFDACLGLGRTAETPTSALSESGRYIYDNASFQPSKSLPEDFEDQIQEWTASLHAAEKAAVQHFLRAKAQDIPLKAYCAHHSLSYQAIHKAARRGLMHLRKNS
jgi:hypothetical protein